MTEVTPCGCYHCASTRTVNGFPEVSTRMIVCPECGNKRCPKSTHHDNACSNSNAPGQSGSRYT